MLTSTPISEKLLLRNRLSEKAKETIPSVAGTPKHLEALLRLHIRHTEQQLQKIEELSESLFHFVANSDTREGIDQSYSLSESSLSIYYKIVTEFFHMLYFAIPKIKTLGI